MIFGLPKDVTLLVMAAQRLISATFLLDLFICGLPKDVTLLVMAAHQLMSDTFLFLIW